MILFGPPAAGKGTQAQNISETYNVIHLSTGDMLRQAVAAKSKIGLEVKAKMDKGLLVSDDIVIEVIRERISQVDCKRRGFLLDGFPRTLPQAMALDKMLGANGITHVLNLKVSQSLLQDRVTGRRIHEPSGRSYHVKFNPPKVSFFLFFNNISCFK